MKILVVEDDKLLRELLSKKLESDGYVVETAEDGETGLAAMRAHKPDLVLLDIIMPKKSGFEVIEAMKGDELLAGLPVMIVSNSGQPVEIERARAMGVKDWVIKTEFNPQEVLEKIKKHEKFLFKE